ncbi:arginase [[Clostridium] sordellii]|uniref:Arginase n=1 Tax=Paraclostridium sordellii TaxID=1505 RepID=A0ABM9RKL0_PARSO|nr:arginase [Paeniclostridium sordellii]CEJ72541.1 agmatinase [[Clostridium] sordellii] [Paeniclostridium sordellii]CEN68094.1 arginase [[Clostridium] sordellii] [Paeniclostridium sordellii]CEN71361.1 arginase [[Clostridium] sordellii] [Paeniclostridium sordellii]CEO21159.1 arginase [[Clostridium] sordellii] [Paeniclostridium sordellii]CEP77046.1 arginase [[Clostridium] sordellii] [Paeniclostridium sordellii]
MDVNIIGVPTFYGCDKLGPQLGPDKLRQKGVISQIKKYNHNVFDLGNIYVKQVDDSDKFLSNPNMKYFAELVEINKNLAHSVNCSLKSGCFPFIVGGDHSIALGSISGVSKYFNKNLAIVWFDAHGDINTFETSESKNVHGMPLASLMGYGDETFKNLYYNDIKINEDNVYHIGGRDIDSGEKSFIENTNMNMFYPKDLKEKGLDSVINNILNNLNNKNINAIHISFDLDFIDSKYVPGTGTRVENGFTVDESKYLLKKLVESGLVKSMDLVKLNPILDVDDTTSNIALDIIDTVFKNIK